MSTSFKKYVCVVCNHVYDEALGDPDTGIKPGTRWQDVPADWTCPDCGATKADFEEMR
jgi:rubredoxin